jgi:hypothetical protein
MKHATGIPDRIAYKKPGPGGPRSAVPPCMIVSWGAGWPRQAQSMGRFEHGRSSFNDHVRDNDKDNDPRDRGRFRYLGLHGLSAGGALSGFTARRLAIARGDQFFLKLQPFVGCHGGLFALRRQIFHQEINACFRRRRCLKRPSMMSQQLKSRTRQARGSTAAALPQQTPLSFAYSTHTQHPWMVVQRALRANYDRQPRDGGKSDTLPNVGFRSAAINFCVRAAARPLAL